jgi:uncharacterized protein YhfF
MSMAIVPAHMCPFWEEFLASLSAPEDSSSRYYDVCRIGSTEEDAEEGARLILRREKTATSSLLWKHQATGAPPPEVGGLSIVENGQGKPVGVIETTWVAVVSFNAVDAGFAQAYGECDGTVDGWRAMCWEYYAEECEELGRKATEDMPLVCERFRLVYP